jgi:hypothetical protein
MAEYVKRDDALCALEQINPVDYGAMWDYEAHHYAGECLRDCKETIDSIPAANVAPVTRCKDCANSYEDAFGRVCTYGICVDCTVPDDFYCASSKPKEGAE